MIPLTSKKFQKIQTRVFFGILILVLVFTVYVVGPYIPAVAWAAILASTFYPLFLKINSYFKNRNVSAAVTTTTIVLIVLIPVSLVAASLVRELISAYDYVSRPETIKVVTKYIEKQRENEFIDRYIEGLNVQEKVEATVNGLGTTVVNFARRSSAFTFSFFAKAFIMLYTLFFLLRDGEKLLERLQRLLPFGDTNERKLYQRFTSTSRATLKGSIFLAIIQGLIAGIGFFIIGLPSIVFFMILVMFLSIIPALGASFVLVPLAFYFFFTAALWKALVLIGFTVFISLSENIIRPKLVNTDIEMHPALFIISTVGGVTFFGLSGVVFGPIIMALLLALLEMYELKYKKDIDREAEE